MAPKSSSNGDEVTPLTDNENRFIKAVFDNMTQKPDANWDAVASALNLKDAKCAKERWRQMSVRHGWRETSGSGGSPRKAAAGGEAKVTKKPRTPRKKGKKAGDDVEVKSEEEEDTKLANDPAEI